MTLNQPLEKSTDGPSFLHRIKWYRRIFTRNDKPTRRFMAFLHFAATLIWLERNVNEH